MDAALHSVKLGIDENVVGFKVGKLFRLAKSVGLFLISIHILSLFKVTEMNI